MHSSLKSPCSCHRAPKAHLTSTSWSQLKCLQRHSISLCYSTKNTRLSPCALGNAVTQCESFCYMRVMNNINLATQLQNSFGKALHGMMLACMFAHHLNPRMLPVTPLAEAAGTFSMIGTQASSYQASCTATALPSRRRLLIQSLATRRTASACGHSCSTVGECCLANNSVSQLSRR